MGVFRPLLLLLFCGLIRLCGELLIPNPIPGLSTTEAGKTRLGIEASSPPPSPSCLSSTVIGVTAASLPVALPPVVAADGGGIAVSL